MLHQWHSSGREGAILEKIIFLFRMTQLISTPAHILKHSSSCIDLIFVNRLNLAIDSGVHLSLHQMLLILLLILFVH